MGDYGDRRDRLVRMLEPGVAYVTCDPIAVRYLTGFSGSSASIAVWPDGFVFVTDGRYRDQVLAECPGVSPLIDRNGIGVITEQLQERGVQRVRLAPSSSVAQVDVMRGAFDTVIVDGEDPVARLRLTKDEGELAALREACAITAEALMAISRVIRVGDREIDIARQLEFEFAQRGAEDRAFPTIVATGAHSAIPHHRPTAMTLSAGDLLVIDCGARVRGYHADMTRTFIVGAEPTEWQREIHAIVAEAAQRGRETVQAGVDCARVDSVARDVIAARGHADAFTHGTGHAVGLVIHEAPMLMRESLGTLAAGMAVTVEPGIYLPERGGVRIEDTLEVTPEGSVVLTEAPRDLMRVG